MCAVRCSTPLTGRISHPGRSSTRSAKAADKLDSAFGLKGAQWTNIEAAGEPFLREFEEHVVGYAVEVRLDVSAEDSSGRQYRTP